jgi:hypothetical protein
MFHVSWVNKVKFSKAESERFNYALPIELYHTNYNSGGPQSVGDSEFGDSYSTAFPGHHFALHGLWRLSYHSSRKN